MKFDRPGHIDGPHWAAIEMHAARVASQLAGDSGGTIGACKDLVECVAKVVVAEATAPEVDDLPRLVKTASQLLGAATPHTDGDAEVGNLAKAIGLLVASHGTAAQCLAELRNDHGSGHGRTTLPEVAPEDVALVVAYTEAWVTWALARLERLLMNSVSTLIGDLTGRIFTRGLLRNRMTEVGLFGDLREEEQERLGFAVAERGVRRETFVVAMDGVSPLTEADLWPLRYQFGVALGLLLAADGRVKPVRLDVLGAILPRLDVDLQGRLLDAVELAPLAVSVIGDVTAHSQIHAALAAMTESIRQPLRDRWTVFVARFALDS